MEWIQVIKSEFDSWLSNKKKHGLDQILLTAQYKKLRGLNVFEKNIDSLELSDQISVGILVSRGDQWGASVCDGFEVGALRNTLQAALQASQYSDPEPNFSLAKPSTIKGLKNYDQETLNLTMAELESIALEIEQKAYGYSSKIFNVPHAACGYDTTETVLLNSEGILVIEGHSLFKASLSCAARGRTDRISNVGELFPFRFYKDFNIQSLVDTVAEETISRLDPQKVTSGSYPVIFDYAMAAQLLTQFQSVFSGDLLYKHMTKLEGKEGQQIASPIVSIIDSPKTGLIPHVYDAEGELCSDIYLVNKGCLDSFLHNRYTAAMVGSKSNGHADGGLGGLPGVSPTNIYWDGTLSADEELLKTYPKALYITDMAGASVSPISGDFSYGAQGYMLENGHQVAPVADFTIAGNFFDLLKKIQGVGKNLKFFSPHRLGSAGGRLLLVESLEVAG